MIFSDVKELQRAYTQDLIDIHALVKVKLSHGGKTSIVETTPGRITLKSVLPDNMPFEMINQVLKKKDVSNLVNECYRRCDTSKQWYLLIRSSGL